jgi:hypothetical protein
MNGMEMMLKSFGVDPEKIKTQLIDAQKVVLSEVERLHSRLDNIDASLRRIEVKFETLPTDEAMKLLANKPDASFIEQELRREYGHSSN